MENSKNHILVVDDDDRIRGLLKDYLANNGYIVSTAENAEQAKNKLEYLKFDIIILDDGFQHKSIVAGFNILLTSYQNMFFKDNLFPIGKLRDRKCESKRAERIIITKCPEQKKIHKEKRKDIYYSF